ncbi:MAG: SPOR domain-containing protein [Thermodesulfobacteriota bacterium]
MKENKRPGGLQTFMFFLGFIVLFFLVFALGVIVGKGLDTEDLFQIKKKEKNEQLLAGSPATIINKNEEKKPDKVEVKEVIKQENKVAEKKPGKVKVKEIVEQEVKVTEKKPAPAKKKEVEVKTTKKDVEKKATKETVKTESVKEDKFVAKLDYNKPDFPDTDQDGKYTVQLGSFQSIDAAYTLEKKLQSKGYPCFVIKAAIPKKGTWYRVRVGTFKSKEKAVAYAEQLKNIEKLEYTQVTLNK